MKKDSQKKKTRAYNDWDFIFTEKGMIKRNSIVNIEVILENDENIADKLAFNEFTRDVELLEDVPLMYSKVKKGVAKNDLEPALLGYMEKQYDVLFTKNNMNDAIVNVANRHKFNPVLDYLEQCYQKWDGTERIHEFFPSFLGVEYSDLTTLISKLWLVGAAKKVYEPLSKFDFVLDLVGGQGTGKTTMLQKLANQWYTDAITDFKDKDNLALMLRAWIVNDDEMVATSNSKFEELKKFVTTPYIEYRKPFDRRAERYEKNFALARTSNHVEYLKDKTGERRFLPLLANPKAQLFHPVTDLTQELVDFIWGEACHLYKGGFSLALSKEQDEELVAHRMNFQYRDDVELAIETYLSIKIPEDFETWDEQDRRYYIQDMMGNGYSKLGVPQIERTKVTSAMIAWECFGKPIASDRKLSNKIKYILDNDENWEKARLRINGIAKDCYQKINI